MTIPRIVPPRDDVARTTEADAALDAAYAALRPSQQSTLFRLMEGGEVAESSASEADWHLLSLLATAGVRDPETLAELWKSSEIVLGPEVAGARNPSRLRKVERLASKTIAKVLTATKQE